MDAYEQCIAKYGVEGTTLEILSKEAGLARALIRHHIGNRDDVLIAFQQRFFKRSAASMRELQEALPDSGQPSQSVPGLSERLHCLISWLFSPQYSDRTLILVANALISVAPKYPDLSKALAQWVEEFEALLQTEVAKAFPKAPEQKCATVATGLMGIYFNADSLSLLSHLRASFQSDCEQSALLLLASLQNHHGD
jgi:AcrR family transcriptional regulator